LHCKQESWSSVFEDPRPSHKYFHKATQIWCFCKDERYAGSYEEWRQLILKGSVEIQYQLGFRLIGFRVYKNFNIS
jgi:hypothetical protein